MDGTRTTRGQAEARRLATEEKTKLELLSERADLEHLISQPQFKRYMKRLIASGGIMRSVFTGNSHTYHKSGRQDFATEIWASIAVIDNKTAIELLLPETKEETNND